MCFIQIGLANNIQVSSAILTGQDAINDTYQIQFDLSWENSWRTSTFERNWDAAWVFVKYRELSPLGEWKHALINETGFVAPTGVTIEPSIIHGSNPATYDNMGAFVYRDANGIGDVNWQGIQLQWDYTSVPDDAVLEICVFAIEMVYVPQGAFYLGDGSGVSGSFEAGTSGLPLLIESEEIELLLGGAAATNLNNNNSGIDDFNDNTVIELDEPLFPKGFNAFYMMKYELSQGQYAAFINKLTPIQQANRFDNSNSGSSGYTITGQGGGNIGPFSASSPDRACGYMNLADLNAYLDWAGLRFPTEFEWEKAARGSLYPVPREFAWGNAELNRVEYILINDGLENEMIINPGANIGNALLGENRGADRPHRCGIFAASAQNPTRIETGASYYGIMELTGNLEEFVVSVSNPEMRSFYGEHGNGVLNANGDSDLNGPLASISVKAGTWVSSANGSFVSRRVGTVSLITRSGFAGLRACRSANNAQ